MSNPKTETNERWHNSDNTTPPSHILRREEITPPAATGAQYLLYLLHWTTSRTLAPQDSGEYLNPITRVISEREGAFFFPPGEARLLQGMLEWEEGEEGKGSQPPFPTLL